KVAGPDGFTSKFFKAAWSVVGSDVCDAVMEFFTSGKLLGEFNANLISLIPKLQTPLNVADFRPIACCYVVYKCISKVVTNRLKEGLNSLVDCNQSAFIPGRQISDNILLTQEFMRGYTWKSGVKKCPFKVDIQKAYDTVNWDFLRTVLHHFGFHSSMVHWIMGDPMSPYLFTIVMEVFNLMVKRQVRLDNRFVYHWGCDELKLTHLRFADDLLLLCHGDHISACILRRALDEFSMCYGLYPSMAKSTAFFGNVPIDIQDQILLAMPFRVGELPVRYLGVPLSPRKLRNIDCRILIEKQNM
ncbi:RNA-directed DNA polymerase, eukaryota, reverse transcriptase zinc-binding domain protein, partial [Tanacetum coccineum]